MKQESKRIFSFAAVLLVAVICAIFLFQLPSIISQANVNITDRDAVLAALDAGTLSGFNLTTNDLSTFQILDHGNTVEYTFQLTKVPGQFSENYIFVPPRSDIRTASELLVSIPGADAVAAYDRRTGKEQGYINFRGGRGNNFQVKPFTVYWVSVTQDANWSVSVQG